MKRLSISLRQLPLALPAAVAAVLVVAAVACLRSDKAEYSAEGVSALLARYRYETINDIRYSLTFTIDSGRTTPVAGQATLEFGLGAGREPLVIDFRAPDDHLQEVVVNGRPVDAVITNGHIFIERKLLSHRYNRIEIHFRAGDLSLNRNDDYLYTLLVPDRASTLFPCFDQPDLKGRFTLTLNIPVEYRAMANNPLVEADTAGSRVTLRYSETPPLSTYLFAFAAGRFELIEREVEGRQMEMLHRETRPGYIENNVDEIFRLHLSALQWLEEYTNIPYPFDKFGFMLLPPFQYSGMEHPGTIFYRASSLLLEPSPTLNEQLSRASLIAHETSHIWFGDLVTMKWFDDVWLKEVFAGYMSDKIAWPGFPEVNHELRFLLSRYPAAYGVDRTSGTNPVIQQLNNLKDAGSLYGAIIYNKAPIVMRQLEQMIGEERLMTGLQRYLSEFEWGNARWSDLIAILEATSKEPLGEWSRMWIGEAGMPVITPVITGDDEWRISFSETDPEGMMRHWPQTLHAMVITASGCVTAGLIPSRHDSFITTGEPPLCIIPDISGRAYGTFIYDSTTIRYLINNLPAIENEILSAIGNDKNPATENGNALAIAGGNMPAIDDETLSAIDFELLKGILWINLFENMVNGTVTAADFYEVALRELQHITDPQLRSYLSGRFADVWWNHLTAGERQERAPVAEALLRRRLEEAAEASEKRSWFSILRNITITPQGAGWLGSLWQGGMLPGRVSLSEDELSTLALTLALKGLPGAERVLAGQRERIASRERQERFDFVMPAVSHDPAVRDALFDSLRDQANRTREPWVLEALGYLHHPMVAERAEHYILPSLEMLEEVKMTGDIFFPAGWITTTLAGHRSATARATVEQFLEDHPNYPEDLRLKILQAADHLMRMTPVR